MPSVPSLKDLCTKNVGENLGTIAKCHMSSEEIEGYDSLELSPFDLIRKLIYNFFIPKFPAFIIRMSE